MMFLLNDTVLDIGLPAETLARLGGPPVARVRLANAVRQAQEVVFQAGSFHAVHSDIALKIAAEIASTSEANAALFVRPDRVRAPAAVAVRLASVSLATLAQILNHQERYGRDPAFINAQVWSLAGEPQPA